MSYAGTARVFQQHKYYKNIVAFEKNTSAGI